MRTTATLTAALLLATDAALASEETPPVRVLDSALVALAWERAPHATDEDLAILGEWKETALGHIPAEAIRRPTYEQVRPLFQDAADRELGAMEFFTDPAWRQEGRAALLTREVLDAITAEFETHAFFRSSTEDTDKKVVRMQWLLLGHKQLVLAYDRACTVFLDDYHFATGKYGYRRFFRMRLDVDSDGHPGIFDIQGNDTPGSSMEWLSGPLNSVVKSVVVVGSNVKCSATEYLIPVTRTIPLLRIERKPAPEDSTSAGESERG